MINKYYQKHKERLRKEVNERYQNLPEEGKGKRRKKAHKDVISWRIFYENKTFFLKLFLFPFYAFPRTGYFLLLLMTWS